MFKFCSLYSGSSGNSFFIESNNTKILVDAGESAKKICEALNNINTNIEDIDAILITHEHSDHTKGLGTLSKKYNIPVYANSETWQAMSSQSEKIIKENKNVFINNKYFELGDLKIFPFSTPHDASNPCGFNIYYDDKKMSIATDLGHMDATIFDRLKNSSFIMLESNYDPEVLKCSSYPYSLKQRIAGPTGHLSNEMAGKTISNLSEYGLKAVMLGHLSKENNFPELAYKTVVEQMIQNNINENSIQISVANRYTNSKVIEL